MAPLSFPIVLGRYHPVITDPLQPKSVEYVPINLAYEVSKSISLNVSTTFCSTSCMFTTDSAYTSLTRIRPWAFEQYLYILPPKTSTKLDVYGTEMFTTIFLELDLSLYFPKCYLLSNQPE